MIYLFSNYIKKLFSLFTLVAKMHIQALNSYAVILQSKLFYDTHRYLLKIVKHKKFDTQWNICNLCSML